MWVTTGQKHLINQLENSLRSQQTAHAYLFTGPPHVGKMTLAIDLTAAVNCRAPQESGAPCDECQPCSRIRAGHHTDVRFVRPGDDPRVQTRISIEQIRQAEHFLSTTSVEGRWKTLIIDRAETLSDGQGEPANALLKTLEEPPRDILIILLAVNPEAVIPTVRSRCRIMALSPMPGTELIQHLTERHGLTDEAARRMAKSSRGCPGIALTQLAVPETADEAQDLIRVVEKTSAAGLEEKFVYAQQLAEVFNKDRSSARESIYAWQRWWRDVLMIQEGLENHVQCGGTQDALTNTARNTDQNAVVEFLRKTQETVNFLDANVNPRLTIERMMLAIP